MRQVIHGDCLDILKNWPEGSIGLVYLDPPFFTQKRHTLTPRDLSAEYTFDDHWDDLPQYIEFLRQRLMIIRRVMNDTACLFFHCDKTASHHIRCLLDEVFGDVHFLSEIIWSYRRWSNPQKTLLPSHQTIFMYSKTREYTFNSIKQGYSETTNLDQILQRRERNADGKTVYARDDDGSIILNGPKTGVPLSDVWEIPYLNPKAKERVGYPTQKPLLLLERIVELASNPGDTVLDAFCGSGTTLVAAANLNRKCVGIDISEKAVRLTESRLNHPIKSESNLLKKGRVAYDNLPPPIKAILADLPVKIVQRNAGIDAIHDDFMDGKPVVIRVQRTGEDVIEACQSLASAGHKKQAGMMILIQTEEKRETAFVDLMPEDVIVIPSTSLALRQTLQAALRETSNPQIHDTLPLLDEKRFLS